MDEKTDRRLRAYAALEALLESIPLSAQHHGSYKGLVQEDSIQLYESALDDLEASGENMAQFRLEKKHAGKVPSVMLASDLQAKAMAVRGYFNIRDSVLNQAKETGAALQELMGFKTPHRP